MNEKDGMDEERAAQARFLAAAAQHRRAIVMGAAAAALRFNPYANSSPQSLTASQEAQDFLRSIGVKAP